MPHFPKPFFRPKKNRWSVQIDGKQVVLGADQETAFKRYHELMAERARGETPKPQPAAPLSVAGILDQFLDWLSNRVAEGNKAKRTYAWYQKYLQSFVTFRTAEYRVRDLTADKLEPIHVYEWVDSQPGWKTGKRGAMVAVQRAFNWAAKAGLLKSVGGRSPLAGLEKTPQGRRDQLVKEGEYQSVLALVRDRQFRDLLETIWETGCRPHELFTVEARFADVAGARWVFPERMSKGRKVKRVVYLTDHALAITKRLMAEHPRGKLFRNTDGVPWTRDAVNCRFLRLKEKTGVKYNLYSFRHTYCTSALQTGTLDAVTVSVLMGHRDTTMISRHYAHLTDKPGYMRDAARRAKGA